MNAIPEYLRPFITQQDPTLYTPMDQAAWRFILKISRHFLKGNAHQKYIDGLRETGISPERIPLIEEMDQCLNRFGWRAVAVNGFIPPSVFMEFQSLSILPIACEMRTMDHLAYTPAPDIVHEAAGHAPIIADPEYSDYLKNYGDVSRKAIFSHQDMDLFEAIRNLSVVKEDPISTHAEVQAAEDLLSLTSAQLTEVSEAAELARMNWWTVEYGLVGTIENPKIYGAGLLSSVGESFHCLSDDVVKLPLTVECVRTGYDITRPQPKLFVTPNFQHLTTVLKEYAETMAFRIGGREALERGLQAKTVTTVVLDSGIQISGKIDGYGLSRNPEEISDLKFTGPVQLSFADSEIPHQGPEHHTQGFSTVLGKVAGRLGKVTGGFETVTSRFETVTGSINGGVHAGARVENSGAIGKCLSFCTEAEIRALGGEIHFESGICLNGELKSVVRKTVDGVERTLIASFDACTILKNGGSADEIVMYRPEWGVFDLACGSKVVSVYGGAADRKNYLLKTGGLRAIPVRPKCNLTPENKGLNELYRTLRRAREEDLKETDLFAVLKETAAALKVYPEDWLLRLEILELFLDSSRGKPESELAVALHTDIAEELNSIATTRADRAELIKRGKEAFLT